jgi:hypothetical protein
VSLGSNIGGGIERATLILILIDILIFIPVSQEALTQTCHISEYNSETDDVG